MQPEAHDGDGPAFALAARIEFHAVALQSSRRSQGAGGTVRTLENCQNTVADELEYIASLRMDGRDHQFGVIVEQRNDLARLDPVGERGIAPKIRKPESSVDAGSCPDGCFPKDAATGILPEVDFDERLSDPRERNALSPRARVGTNRRKAEQCASLNPRGCCVVQWEKIASI